MKEYPMVHIPIVICIDISGSMTERDDDNNTKVQSILHTINEMSKIDLSENEEVSVDVCVLSFSDNCQTVMDWIPLLEFKGSLVIENVGGCADVCSTFMTAIKILLQMSKKYDWHGIVSKERQILLYTDEISETDLAVMEEELKKFDGYHDLPIKLSIIAVGNEKTKSFNLFSNSSNNSLISICSFDRFDLEHHIMRKINSDVLYIGYP